MPDDAPKSVVDVLSKVTGLTQGDIKATWERVKANQKLLDECKGHDFSKPFEQRGQMVVKWQCSRCSGIVDTTAKKWYERGLTDGLRRG